MNIGIKDVNGKEIKIGNKVKMHYFYQGFGANMGAIEKEDEIVGIIKSNPELGIYVEDGEGNDYILDDCLQEPSEELEIIEEVLKDE